MKAVESRLINGALIPTSLWDHAEQTLHLPELLQTAYEKVIGRHNLRELATSRDLKNPPVGGLTLDQAKQHFAQQFDGSAARAQLALLDPNGHVTPASEVYLKSLAGNRLCLTDAPCGAGAAAYAFLTTIAELRKCNVLPRMPLDVFLIGAEISQHARAFAQEMFDELRHSLREEGIVVHAEFMAWNVIDPLSNTDLIKRMNQISISYPQSLLVVANFTGFLERDSKRKDAERQLEELFRFSSGPNNAAIWIEPNTNTASHNGGLFTWLTNKIRSPWSKFTKERTSIDNSPLTTSSKFMLPLAKPNTARVTLAVKPIDLERSE